MTLQLQFEKELESNPTIWDMFKNRCLIKALSPETTQISAKHIMHMIRDEKKIKIDNSLISRYAHKIVNEHPQLKHLFILKPLSTD